jgi:hypothetical protein
MVVLICSIIIPLHRKKRGTWYLPIAEPHAPALEATASSLAPASVASRIGVRLSLRGALATAHARCEFGPLGTSILCSTGQSHRAAIWDDPLIR